ncbi:MAG: hypothetical protein MHPSP_002405, partial [Paramarteilia canceri]
QLLAISLSDLSCFASFDFKELDSDNYFATYLKNVSVKFDEKYIEDLLQFYKVWKDFLASKALKRKISKSPSVKKIHKYSNNYFVAKIDQAQLLYHSYNLIGDLSIDFSGISASIGGSSSTSQFISFEKSNISTQKGFIITNIQIFDLICTQKKLKKNFSINDKDEEWVVLVHEIRSKFRHFDSNALIFSILRANFNLNNSINVDGKASIKLKIQTNSATVVIYTSFFKALKQAREKVQKRITEIKQAIKKNDLLKELVRTPINVQKKQVVVQGLYSHEYFSNLYMLDISSLFDTFTLILVPSVDTNINDSWLIFNLPDLEMTTSCAQIFNSFQTIQFLNCLTLAINQKNKNDTLKPAETEDKNSLKIYKVTSTHSTLKKKPNSDIAKKSIKSDKESNFKKILTSVSEKFIDFDFKHIEETVLSMPVNNHRFISQLDIVFRERIPTLEFFNQIKSDFLDNMEISINAELLFYMQKVLKSFISSINASALTSPSNADIIIKSNVSPISLPTKSGPDIKTGDSIKTPTNSSESKSKSNEKIFRNITVRVINQEWAFEPNVILVSPAGQKIESINAKSIFQTLGLTEMSKGVPQILHDTIMERLFAVALEYANDRKL